MLQLSCGASMDSCGSCWQPDSSGLRASVHVCVSHLHAPFPAAFEASGLQLQNMDVTLHHFCGGVCQPQHHAATGR